MSAGTNNNVTSFRWEIVDLKRQCKEFRDRNEVMYSDTFPLIVKPDIQFALRVDPKFDFLREDAVGIILKQLDDDEYSVKIDVKLWIESSTEKKIGNTFLSACEFYEVNVWFPFDGISGTSFDDFYELYNKNETFFICCELSNLRTHTPALELLQIYRQSNWSLYEQGVHDAVIKVEDNEYKVSKVFFMAQSDVFKHMFLSNFKEGITNTINVNDVKKETMEHLIKWIYTGQIEDEAHIENLFVAADKYNIKLLKRMCLEIMMDNMNTQNVFSRLTLAAMHNESQLKQVALGVIVAMSKYGFYKFTMSQKWIELNRKHPKIADEIVNWIHEKMNA